MRAFEYASPSTRDEVIEILAKHQRDAAVLAGGTDLLSLMKDDIETPSVLVDIKGISGASGISQASDGSLTIGALVTLEELIGSEPLRSRFPSLVQAARGVRSPQIRSRGTVGGDLCQRPRCWYYRNGFGLLPVKDGQSLVEVGDNRYHAILGASGQAHFVNPSSLAPALITLDARVKIFGSQGEREVPLSRFYRVPASDSEREYDLGPEDIILSVTVPRTADSKDATYEVRQRDVLDWPLAAAAVSLVMSGDRVTSARIVMGHVAPTPWIAADAESMLQGKRLTPETADAAGKEAVKGARPLSKNGYKVRLAHVAVKRALLSAAGLEVPA